MPKAFRPIAQGCRPRLPWITIRTRIPATRLRPRADAHGRSLPHSMRPVSILCLATVFSIVLGSIGAESPVVTANAANSAAESIAEDAETLENGSIRARQKALARV